MGKLKNANDWDAYELLVGREGLRISGGIVYGYSSVSASNGATRAEPA